MPGTEHYYDDRVDALLVAQDERCRLDFRVALNDAGQPPQTDSHALVEVLYQPRARNRLANGLSVAVIRQKVPLYVIPDQRMGIGSLLLPNGLCLATARECYFRIIPQSTCDLTA